MNIPVPRVLAWGATDQNPAQAEYIIMEEARGSQFHEVWQDLSLRKKADIIREFVDIGRKLPSVSFDKKGSTRSNSCGRFNLYKLADCDHCILKIVTLQDVSRLSLQLIRKMSWFTLNQLIALGPSLEENSGRNSAVACHIMVPVSF